MDYNEARLNIISELVHIDGVFEVTSDYVDFNPDNLQKALADMYDQNVAEILMDTILNFIGWESFVYESIAA